MNQFFDVYTLIFLVLAVVIFLRLRNVLGRRTGTERPPYDPYAPRDKTRPSGNDKVVALPNRAGPPPQAANDASDPDQWKGVAEPGSELAKGLSAIRASDSAFDVKHFLGGARTAYEMIVTAFAEGDRKTLKNLLSRDVYDGFVSAITERETRGERIDSNFIGIDKAEIIEAGMKGNSEQITVRFLSKLITATYAKGGDLVDGDPKQVSTVTDIWTFAREANARDPNWKLVATESA